MCFVSDTTKRSLTGQLIRKNISSPKAPGGAIAGGFQGANPFARSLNMSPDRMRKLMRARGLLGRTFGSVLSNAQANAGFNPNSSTSTAQLRPFIGR